MTEILQPNSVISATSVPLDLVPLAPEQSVSAEPLAGSQDLAAFGETEIGIWEHTPGVSTDTEADEVFVVLAGAATVELLDSGEVLELAPGVVGRLAAGTRTRWNVTQTLRKIYIA